MPENKGFINPNLDSTKLASPIHVGLALILREAESEGPENCDSDLSRLPRSPQVLVTQRPVGTICGGAWEFPGGKVEAGEDSAMAASREALEEVGVRVRIVASLPEVIHTYPHGTVRLCPWVCELEPMGQTPENLSVAAHRWVRPDEIEELEFLEANAVIVDHLRAYIEKEPDMGHGR
jgi:8-oxo-dGTP diphosphatase